MVRVPLDYRDPRGAAVKLALIRHRASDQSRRLGSVFFNPGGPGGSGVAALPDLVRHYLPAALVARFDWVSWDPRGVGASTAVQCFASKAQEQRFLPGIPGQSFPVGRMQTRRWINRYRALAELCRRRDGSLLEHVSTADSARDLDLLRRAVGDRRLNYYGFSYGTFLGATYANLFPNRVRAMVLVSNIDPRAFVRQSGRGRDADLSTFLRQRSDRGAAKTLRAFLSLCGGTDTAHCAFSAGSPAATRTKFANLLARLRQRPLDGVSYANLVASTVAGLHDSTTGWRTLATALQKVWASSSSPSPQLSHSARSTLRKSRASAGPAASHRYSGIEQYLAILCSDSPNPRPAAFPGMAAFAYRRSGAVGPYSTWLSEPCASWRLAADRYTGPWNHHTSNPVLVTGNTYDPAAPYRGSVTMARELARARLLTIDGYGHGAPSTCALRYQTHYLIDQVLPPKGTRCRQNPQPFSQ